jgi:hypothetical protein
VYLPHGKARLALLMAKGQNDTAMYKQGTLPPNVRHAIKAESANTPVQQQALLAPKKVHWKQAC